MTDHERGIEAAALALANRNSSEHPEAFRGIAEASISAYLAAEPGKPESGVLAEAAAGYLFEMRYESDRWSGTMFAEQINLPASDVRNVRPLYSSPPKAEAVKVGSELIDDLRKFFAQTVEWADEHGWTDKACQNDRIVDWFGPSDFFEMRNLLVGLDAQDDGLVEASKIGDAVLTWLVKHDLADADNEYDDADVIEILNDLAPSQQTAELDQINAMLCEGQGDDDGHQILPDFAHGSSVYAKVEACLQLLERRRDIVDSLSALSTPPQPEAALHAEPCEPVGYVAAVELTQLRLGASCVDLFGQVVPKDFEMVPLYASPAPSLGVDIETLQRRVEELEAALKPFAKAGQIIDGPFGPALFREDDMAFQSGCAWSENGERRTITWGDFRHARAALIQEQKKDG